MTTLDHFNIIDIAVKNVNDVIVQNRPNHNCWNKVWQLLSQTEKHGYHVLIFLKDLPL